MSHEPPDPFADGRDTFTEPDHHSAPAAWAETHRTTPAERSFVAELRALGYSPEGMAAWTEGRLSVRDDTDETLSPARPVLREEDVRATVVHQVVRFIHEAPLDEVRLLAELVTRIESGRRAYGAWSAASEKRDMAREEHEEHLDALVYSSMRRVMGRRSSP